MKKPVSFFPYFLSDTSTGILFVTWLFIIKDLLHSEEIKTSFYIASCLLLFLLIRFVPKYLKGFIPNPFTKGIQAGLKHTLIGMLIWGVGLTLMTIYRPLDDRVLIYQIASWFAAFLALLPKRKNRSNQAI
jgi:hypothetical protein